MMRKNKDVSQDSLFKLIPKHTQGSYTVVVLPLMLLLLLKSEEETEEETGEYSVQNSSPVVKEHARLTRLSLERIFSVPLLLFLFFILSSSSSDCRRLCLQ